MTTQDDVRKDERYRLVGNHGFIGLIETMGSDETIEQTARVSYGQGTRKVSERRALLRYLLKHAHTSPFEMAEVRFHAKIPIFVMRQWIRHRTANVNEYSGRYSEMVDDMFVPKVWRKQSTSNKQGSGDVFPDVEPRYGGPPQPIGNQDLSREAENVYSHALTAYKTLLERGVSKEMARMVLPVANYTEFYWKIDLHNFMHFLKLRTDSHAQAEIREFTDNMLELARPHFPLCFEAWDDYVRNAEVISGPEMELLRKMFGLQEGLPGEPVLNLRYALNKVKSQALASEYEKNGTKILNCPKHFGLSKREWVEFLERWGLEE